jgi:hypothetical protein
METGCGKIWQIEMLKPSSPESFFVISSTLSSNRQNKSMQSSPRDFQPFHLIASFCMNITNLSLDASLSNHLKKLDYTEMR